MPKPKIVVLCGSTRFIEEMAVCGWLIERDERAIVLSCHLLPAWYGAECDHQAEAEGVKEKLDELHLRKIDMADEVFVVSPNTYVGESTHNEIKYAQRQQKPVRMYFFDPIGREVDKLIAMQKRSPPPGFLS